MENVRLGAKSLGFSGAAKTGSKNLSRQVRRGGGDRSPGEGVEAVGLACFRKRHPQPRHQRGVEDDGGTFVASGQVDGGHRADALTVQDDVLRRHSVPGGGQATNQRQERGHRNSRRRGRVTGREDLNYDPTPHDRKTADMKLTVFLN